LCPDAGTLVDQQCEELGRLPESHVVGEARAETEVTQEGEPTEPALLIRAQLPGKAVRCRNGPELPVVGTGEKVPEPPVGLDGGHRQVTRGLF
jgi:hypothetical protein